MRARFLMMKGKMRFKAAREVSGLPGTLFNKEKGALVSINAKPANNQTASFE